MYKNYVIILGIIIFSCTKNDSTQPAIPFEKKYSENHFSMNLANLRKNFGNDEAVLLKRKQFSQIDLLDENSGRIIFLNKNKANRIFENLLETNEYIIEFRVFDHITDDWKNKSLIKNNWNVLDGYKYIRDDGFIDFCFRVIPGKELIGIEVLISNNVAKKSELPNSELYIWFAGDSPNLNRLSNKKIAMLNSYGRFYHNYIFVNDIELQRLYIKTRYDKIPFTSKDEMENFKNNFSLFQQHYKNEEKDDLIFKSIMGSEK